MYIHIILCYYELVNAKQSVLGAAGGKLWGELGRNYGLTTSRFPDVSAKHLITSRIWSYDYLQLVALPYLLTACVMWHVYALHE